MKKYWVVIKLAWQEYFAHRLHFFFEIAGNILIMLAIIALWFAIFNGNGDKTIGGYSLSEMVTYMLLAGLINGIIWQTGQGDEINDEINQGLLSRFLIKPIIMPLYWLARDFSRKILTLFLGILEFFIIFYFFRNYLVGPFSLKIFLLAILAIVLSAALHYFIFYIFSIIAFWLEETWGERFVLRVVMELATGALVPLTFFPFFWQTLFNFLPFKYLIFFPLQVYLGKLDAGQIAQGFLIACAWLLGLIFLSWVIWRKGIKKYSAYGA